MGQRISNRSWQHLKETFPEDIEKLTHVTFTTSRSNIAFLNRRFYRRVAGKKLKKTNTELYGVDLGVFFDWLDENSESQYYAKMDNKTRHQNTVKIDMYFFEETDAIAFKIVFGEKDLTFIET